jgi:DNA-binding transcriptional ArsR family regulator
LFIGNQSSGTSDRLLQPAQLNLREGGSCVKSAAADVGVPTFVSESLAKALAHELRVKILVELNQRVMSVSQFVRAFPQHSHSKIYAHFRKLEELGCIELVEKKSGGKRRGATEHFFRATERSLFDQTSWAMLPESIKSTVTGAAFTIYIERVSDAIKAGTIDIRPDRHFTWTDAHFDQQAWDETIEDVEILFQRTPERQAEAAVRLVESGEEPIRVTVALACFESPRAPMQAPHEDHS